MSFSTFTLACSLLMSSTLLLSSAQENCVTPEDIQKYVAGHRDEWMRKISPGQQRLFYTEDQLDKRLLILRKGDAVTAKQRTLLLEAARRICETPLPKYQKPREGVKFASEEGWIRSFGDQLVAVTVAAKLERNPIFDQRIHDMVMAACGFETWGRQGKNGELRNMDLAAGQMARALALAYDWNRSLFSDVEKEIIRKTVTERVHCLLQGLYGGIFWASWYSQNHNHVSVAGMGLAGLVFLDEIPEAADWLAGALIDMQRAAEALPADGSSYEGVAYWGYGRSYIIQFIEGTRNVTGSDALYQYDSMKNAAEFRIGCSLPGLNGTVMWADSRGFDVSGPQQILYALAAYYRDSKAQYLADQLPGAPCCADNIAWALLWRDPSVAPVRPTQADYFFRDWNVVVSRSGSGAADYLVSLKSGEASNHHTQLDLGSLEFSFGGEWLLMAPGYGLGSGQKGFFDRTGERWKFFSNATESHTTLLINGKNQRTSEHPDDQSRGTIDHYLSTPGSLWTEVDLSRAYQDIQSVRRRLLHRRGKYILVLDEVAASTPVTVDWIAQVPPRARCDAHSLQIDGGLGRLKIQLLGDAAPFEPYKPYSTFVDVSPNRMISFSSKKNGQRVNFATLLEPRLAGEQSVDWSAQSRAENDGSHVIIQSANWQDDIWIAQKDLIHFDADDKTLSAQAAFLAVVQESRHVVSLIAGQVRFLHLGFLKIKTDTPADLATELAPGGAWILDLGSPLKGSVELSAGWTLRRIAGKSVAVSSVNPVDLPPGRYIIVRDNAKTEAALTWAETFPDRTPAPFPLAPKPELPAINSSVKIAWEAEDSPLKRYDYAQITNQARASAGKALTGLGVDSPADSVGWKIKVSAPGMYALKLRFSSTQPEIHFAVLVDGKLPCLSAADVSIRAAKGWGAEKYFDVTNFDWISASVTDASTGHILAIPLTAGEHEIRLTNPTEPLNLDSLELSGIPGAL
jgi:hypothetical protein